MKLFQELTQCSPKEHSPIFLFVVQKFYLILFYDNICLKNQEDIKTRIKLRQKKREKGLWQWYSYPKHVNDFHEQEDIKIIKQRNPKYYYQGTDCLWPQLINEETQCFTKKYPSVILYILDKFNLIMCNDNICMKHQEDIIL